MPDNRAAAALVVMGGILVSCGAKDRGASVPPVMDTATPIKHVIIIVGENRSFDHLFATYVPPNPQEHVLNLLSEQIIRADGTPGDRSRDNLPNPAQAAGTYVPDNMPAIGDLFDLFAFGRP
jgi:phospholipase C